MWVGAGWYGATADTNWYETRVSLSLMYAAHDQSIGSVCRAILNQNSLNEANVDAMPRAAILLSRFAHFLVKRSLFANAIF